MKRGNVIAPFVCASFVLVCSSEARADEEVHLDSLVGLVAATVGIPLTALGIGLAPLTRRRAQAPSYRSAIPATVGGGLAGFFAGVLVTVAFIEVIDFNEFNAEVVMAAAAPGVLGLAGAFVGAALAKRTPRYSPRGSDDPAGAGARGAPMDAGVPSEGSVKSHTPQLTLVPMIVRDRGGETAPGLAVRLSSW